MTTREQVMNTLLDLLAGSGEFATVGRRNRSPESFSPATTPALMVVKHSESSVRQSPNLPAKRTLNIRAIIYIDVGDDENAIPESIINNLLEGFDAVMKPDDPGTGKCTLGGLVYSAMIDGDDVEAPGDVTGKGLAIVSIKVILP
jgi:hypothetical protein